MDSIKIETEKKNNSYEIFIGYSLLSNLKKFLSERYKCKKIIILTDDNVKKLYEHKIKEKIKKFNPMILSVPPGEKSKSRGKKQEIEDILLNKKYARDTLIIAFGGGVVGDLAGYIAATFNRGVPFIQIPTSLLAMVDASFGGKTGVNTKHGKNLIGAIWHPEAVFADLKFLDTLPEEEFLSGLAEIIKMALILDRALFFFIRNNHEKIMTRQKEILLYIIKRSVELKGDIVQKDERESGLRQILNFGHTFCHAYENYSNYNLKHGFCVSIGMAVESKIAVLLGELDKSNEKKILELLNKLKLPTKIQENIETNKIIEIMKIDKKTIEEKLHFVILEDIGSVKKINGQYSFEVEEHIIKEAINLCKND